MNASTPLSLALAITALISFSNKTYAISETSEVKELPKLLQVVQDPIPIRRTNPEFPRQAAINGSEGWVTMSIVVGKDGSVKEATVLDNAGHRDFKREAIRAVKKWRYEPAMLGDETIERCVDIQFDFQLVGGGVSKKFSRLYNDAVAYINENKYDSLKELIFNKRLEDKLTMTELAYLDNLKAMYYNKVGQHRNELYALTRAVKKPKHKNYSSNFEDDVLARMLHDLFVLEVNHNRLYDAMRTFDSLELVRNGHATSYIARLEPYKTKIVELINSDKPITLVADMSRSGLWRHKLTRSAFAIDNISNGELDQLDIRCNKKNIKYTVVPGSQWTIPESWGSCSVLVSGDAGTQFSLVELPAPQKTSSETNLSP